MQPGGVRAPATGQGSHPRRPRPGGTGTAPRAGRAAGRAWHRARPSTRPVDRQISRRLGRLAFDRLRHGSAGRLLQPRQRVTRPRAVHDDRRRGLPPSLRATERLPPLAASSSQRRSVRRAPSAGRRARWRRRPRSPARGRRTEARRAPCRRTQRGPCRDSSARSIDATLITAPPVPARRRAARGAARLALERQVDQLDPAHDARNRA